MGCTVGVEAERRPLYHLRRRGRAAGRVPFSHAGRQNSDCSARKVRWTIRRTLEGRNGTEHAARVVAVEEGALMRRSKALTAVLVLLGTTPLAARTQAQTSSCVADTDCTTGMVCRSQTITTCTGGTAKTPCTTNTVCDPAKVEPASCSESTVNLCVCRWPLACSADADCGDGFFCQPATITTCSGAAGTGSAGAGTGTRSSGGGTGAASGGSGGSSSGLGGGPGGTGDPVPVPPLDAVPTSDAGVSMPPTCTGSTSYPGTCRPKVTACNSDADCPSPWTCVSGGLPVAVASPAPVDAGLAVPLPPDVATGTGTGTTTTTTTTLVGVCQSPCGRTYGGSDGPQGTVSLRADAGTSKGTTPTVPPVVAPSDEGAGATGNSTDTKTTPAAKTGSSGCTVGSGETSSATLSLLGLAVALSLLGRKRQRR